MLVSAGNVYSISPEGVVSPSLLGFARMGSTAVGILALPSILRGVIDPLYSSILSKVRLHCWITLACDVT